MYKLPYSLQRCDTDADIICTFKDIVHCSAFVFFKYIDPSIQFN